MFFKRGSGVKGGAYWGRGEQGGRENEVVTCLLLLLQHIVIVGAGPPART
jgi:hypothetical protein